LNSCKFSYNQYAIGLDIGGTNLRGSLLDLKKETLAGDLYKQPVFIDEYSEKRMHFFCKYINSAVSANKNGNHSLNKLEDFLKNKSLQTEHGVLTDLVISRICDLIIKLKKGFDVKFVAISSAGVINEKGFCLCAYNLPFTCVDIRQRIENITNIPTFVANDINCAALGEKYFGALKFIDKFIIVGLGSGFAVKEFDFTDGICQEVGLTYVEDVLVNKKAFN
jgi:predicted NBD/HSP70 family sugar kinase